MKKTAVILIRDWVRTNGNMSGDGKLIAYSCKNLEKVIAQVIELEKKQIESAYKDSTSQFSNDARIDYPKSAEQYYNEKFKNK